MRGSCSSGGRTGPPSRGGGRSQTHVSGTEATWWGTFEDDDELCDLDPAAPRGTPTDTPTFLVCTHGRRDPCCAGRGWPVAVALTEEFPEQTWQCSHVGGDRFAANVVILPHGLYYGHVTPDDAVDVARRHLEGRVTVDVFRGRSIFAPAEQAAQHFARLEHGLDGIDELRPLDLSRQPDGRRDRPARGRRRHHLRRTPGARVRADPAADVRRAGRDADPRVGAGRPPVDSARGPRITVVGSVNLDLVARVERLPQPGETVGGATFARVPGGKGANQALACATARRRGDDDRGGRSRFDGRRGARGAARRWSGAASSTSSDEPTGVALIQVDAGGETTIAVAPGANGTLAHVELPPHDAVLSQLEVPDAAVLSAWEQCAGMFCLNAAPARPIAIDADLTVVNRHELEALARRDGLVALTLGAEGAVLLDDDEEIARAEPPPVDAVDGTAAGDAFTACLLVSLLEGRAQTESLGARVRSRRARRLAVRRPAVVADGGRGRRAARRLTRGTLVVSHHKRCPRPTRDNRRMATPIILDCDPGHDDAIALLLALGSPELELLGVTTTYGNQTLEKTTANALRVLELAGRTDVPVAPGAAEPLERELVVAAHVHGESGLDGPDPASAERRAGLDRRGRLDRRRRSTPRRRR